MNKTSRGVSFFSLPKHIIRPYSFNRYPKQPLSSQHIPSTPLNDSIKIGHYRANKTDMLGKGFCSIVYKATHQQTGKQVALKLINLDKIKSPVQKRFLKNELKCLTKLKSAKYIIHLHQIIQTNTHIAIITELCKHNLSQLIKINNHSKILSTNLAIKIFEETLIGYLAMRAEGLIHRDIKPANILIGMDGQARLCDLGFATEQENVELDRFVNVGSPLYMAPEILKSNNYSSKGDIWALGLVLLEMLIGELPWTHATQKQLKHAIMSTNFQQLIPRNLQAKWKFILLKCLQPDPNNRCGTLELIKFIKPNYEESTISQQTQTYQLNEIPLTFTQPSYLQQITITTSNTEPSDQLTYRKNKNSFNISNKRIMFGRPRPSTNQINTINLNTNNSKSFRNTMTSHSSKKLKTNQNLIQQDLIYAKLNPNSQEELNLIKKQQLSNLNLARFIFKLIELTNQAKDNIHCTYLNLSKELLQVMANTIFVLLKDIKQLKSSSSYKSIKDFKISKQYRSILGIALQYQNNYRQFFKIKLQLTHSADYQVEWFAQQLTSHIETAYSHLLLIFQQIQNSELQEINDQQICQFVALMDCMNTLVQLVKLKNRNPNVFSRTNKIEDLLKKQMTALTIKEINSIKNKFIN